jgi:hypothetical protein
VPCLCLACASRVQYKKNEVASKDLAYINLVYYGQTTAVGVKFTVFRVGQPKLKSFLASLVQKFASEVR